LFMYFCMIACKEERVEWWDKLDSGRAPVLCERGLYLTKDEMERRRCRCSVGSLVCCLVQESRCFTFPVPVLCYVAFLSQKWVRLDFR
jgi:hypothetical protein